MKRTKLSQAVGDNDLPKVTSLINEAKKFGVEEKMIEIPDRLGWTPLIWASYKNNLPMVKLLIQEGAIVSKKSKYGDTAAHLAAYNGSNDVLRHLLIIGVNVDEQGECNLTLLHAAAERNRHSTVEMLLNEFAGNSFINDNSNDYKRTPLTCAICWNGDLKMVKILIGAGANKDMVDRDNKTAFDYAKEKNKSAVVKYLKK